MSTTTLRRQTNSPEPPKVSQTKAASAHHLAARSRRAILGVVGIALFVGVWGSFVAVWNISPRTLPSPARVAIEISTLVADSEFWGDVATTMTAWAIGVSCAISAAIPIGIIIGSSTFLRRSTRSTIEFLRPIPSVALIPVVVLLFGFDMTSSVVLVIKAAFWPTLLQTLYGVADVDPVADETARMFGFGAIDRARYVVLPSAFPYILTGVRLSVAIGLVLTITAELVIPAPGIGAQIGLAQASGATDQLYALIVISGMIGLLLNIVVRRGERRILHWHDSVRRETSL